MKDRGDGEPRSWLLSQLQRDLNHASPSCLKCALPLEKHSLGTGRAQDPRPPPRFALEVAQEFASNREFKACIDDDWAREPVWGICGRQVAHWMAMRRRAPE